MQFRPATADDGPEFLRLVRALAEFEQLDPPTPEACERMLEHAFGEPRRFELWIAELDGAVVAYAVTFHTYSTFRALPTLFLEDLFVHPDARRRGVARGMLDHLKSVARERGCGRFEWMVLDWNEDAKQLYDGYGAQRLREWELYRYDL
jgi:GNAT superfamily N-acetyltransferase